ncbi:MAG: hypothetical protein P0Y49_04850 [Candidatus Pedobacter colombiensis]|uniref:Uncharacterized protein n=1 Tax=Candidatus Pedobacter colombiensis TaxID=3121371 RepID=A0AAJ5W9Y9_9SPHI|nr:hypothetical protein [Pedobacter sp.]WEK20465.1 MAG: hypothetical protein P0Y49_04850 [Pedobacter sp.]
MELRKANATTHDQLILKYQMMSNVQLKNIEPKWALAKDEIFDHTLLPEYNRYLFFLVKTSQLMAIARFNEIDNKVIFSDKPLNNFRIAMILNRWENNLFVDPPTIYLPVGTTSYVEFSDGRHRAKLCGLLCHDEIPVAIDKEDLQAISKILSLTQL